MTTATEIVWEGADALRQFLVPIDSLEPFPGNPRRGDVDNIRTMLREFGQVAPLVIDGTRIVKGHHVRAAAAEEGYTHVAAIPHTFGGEAKQRAFLVGDNRASERGSTDTALLVDHLKYLAELDALIGTGYDQDDLDRYLADLARHDSTPPLELPEPPAPAQPLGDIVEIVLVLTKKQRDEMDKWVKIVQKEKGTSVISDTIFEALRIAAHTLNQQPG